jgi:hypothetical protein
MPQLRQAGDPFTSPQARRPPDATPDTIERPRTKVYPCLHRL